MPYRVQLRRSYFKAEVADLALELAFGLQKSILYSYLLLVVIGVEKTLEKCQR